MDDNLIDKDPLGQLMTARLKKFEDTDAAWRDLRKYIDPLLVGGEKELLSKLNIFFLMYPLDDLVLFTAVLARIAIFPKSFCLKCGREIEADSKS